MGNINAKDPDYWNVPDDPGTRNYDWMGRLPQDKLLSSLSVPGTHDTMARAGDLIWVWCQSLSLTVQMSMGIRFLDIRCRHYHNGLPIHHGKFYQGCNFTDCLRDMVAFLSSNPSEVLLVRVKEEKEDFDDPSGNTRSFCESVLEDIRQFPGDKFWFSGSMPTIGQAKGKIVILPDFDQEGKDVGVPYNSLIIADDWKKLGDDKWNSIKDNLERAQNGSSTNMYLTYSSASAGGQAPREIARSINTRLHIYVTGRYGRMGIIAIDYPGPKLVQDIIKSNF